jgi:hypothetical protein
MFVDMPVESLEAGKILVAVKDAAAIYSPVFLC